MNLNKCERCGCFFETDEFSIIERYGKIHTEEYYLTILHLIFQAT